MPLEDGVLGELKIAQARIVQQVFASDALLEWFRFEHACRERMLTDWEKRLRSLARRHRSNPVRFCELVMGHHWFASPIEGTPRQVSELLKLLTEISVFVGAPLDTGRVDGKALLKRLQVLAARPPGRKRSESYARAFQLRQQGKSFHDICKQLNPAYRLMSPADRRNDRERMRSGVARLERKATEKSKGYEIPPANSRAN